jgi:hypothetical protein
MPEVRVYSFCCLLADLLVGATRTKLPVCGEVATGRCVLPV